MEGNERVVAQGREIEGSKVSGSIQDPWPL
jgi:hypothetical protein